VGHAEAVVADIIAESSLQVENHAKSDMTSSANEDVEVEPSAERKEANTGLASSASKTEAKAQKSQPSAADVAEYKRMTSHALPISKSHINVSEKAAAKDEDDWLFEFSDGEGTAEDEDGELDRTLDTWLESQRRTVTNRRRDGGRSTQINKVGVSVDHSSYSWLRDGPGSDEDTFIRLPKGSFARPNRGTSGDAKSVASGVQASNPTTPDEEPFIPEETGLVTAYSAASRPDFVSGVGRKIIKSQEGQLGMPITREKEKDDSDIDSLDGTSPYSLAPDLADRVAAVCVSDVERGIDNEIEKLPIVKSTGTVGDSSMDESKRKYDDGDGDMAGMQCMLAQALLLGE
jgi:hypothetical protein